MSFLCLNLLDFFFHYHLKKILSKFFKRAYVIRFCPPGITSILFNSKSTHQYTSLLRFCHNKVPETGWFKQQKCVTSQFGDWKSEIKILSGLGASEGHEAKSVPCFLLRLIDLQMVFPPLFSHCLCYMGICLCTNFSFFGVAVLEFELRVSCLLGT